MASREITGISPNNKKQRMLKITWFRMYNVNCHNVACYFFMIIKNQIIFLKKLKKTKKVEFVRKKEEIKEIKTYNILTTFIDQSIMPHNPI
jgi:hypothetical protein